MIRNRVAASKYRTRATYAGSTYHELSAQNKPTTIEIPNRRKGIVLNFPDELLCMIVRFATSKGAPERCQKCNCEPEHDRGTVKALSRTCRKLSRIVFPLLYHSIRFEYPPSRKAFQRLRHAVSKQQPLLHFCRRLSIRMRRTFLLNGGISAKDCTMVDNFISCMKGVRCLELDAGTCYDGNRAWVFIRSLTRNAPRVEHLAVVKNPLKRVMDNIDLPPLGCLDVHQLSPLYSGGHVLLDPKKRRTASFTSLSLPHSRDSLEVLSQLLQWPKTLSHFRFLAADYYGYNSGIYIDTPSIHSVLLLHRDTLKSLSIGFSYSQWSEAQLFDASAFPNLETLTILGNPKRPRMVPSTMDADSLLAPNLKTIEWNFRVDEVNVENWLDFGDGEQRWVCGLAKEAVARQSALREIKINFDPDPRSSRMKDGYPWDRMDKIRNEIRHDGIELVYSKPAVTKERWLERGSFWSSFGRRDVNRDLSLDREGNIFYQGVDIRERAPPEGFLEEFGIKE